jgi:RNA polymerase sigma factor (TIGR02999 family)
MFNNKSNGEITKLLQAGSSGDQMAFKELLPLVYEELRKIAAGLFHRERSDHTLQPTALVHEAFVRLVGGKEISWQNRAHFFGIAANSMRQILVNYAESRGAEKRGGQVSFVSLDEAIDFLNTQNIEILTLHRALEKFAEIDPQQSRIVELRFFGGLTIEETAEVLDLSSATIGREWMLAKLWLKRELREND